MKKRPPLMQKSGIVSPFYSFLWIFVAVFGMLYSPSDVFAVESLYSAKGKRDPFVQLVGSSSHTTAGGLLGVESVEEIMVEGLVYDTDLNKSIVIANGSVLRQGEESGAVKVLKIDSQGALFSVNGIEGYRALYEESKKASGEKNN